MSVSKATEVELKYSVPEGLALPSLEHVGEAGTRPVALLEAVYYDTADRTLLAARIALRRRTGGHDPGWHVKLPAGRGRTELQAPLTPGDGSAPPAELEGVLRSRLRRRDVEPIALIRSERHAVVVTDARGGAVEVVDDHVTATDVSSGTVRTWREWEAEQVGDPDASAALLARVDAALTSAGATPSASPAKLAQALGLVAAPSPAAPRTAGALLAAAVHDRSEEVHRGIQALVLDGDPDGAVVHELRRSLRRIRSLLALGTVAGPAGTALRQRLGTMGARLGDARDPLVQAAVAERLIEPVPEDVPGLGEARRLLVDEPRAALPAGVRAAIDWLGSAEALDVLAALEAFDPDGAHVDARPRRLAADAERLVRRARRRARRSIDGDLDALHRARKGAKRARFVVEELVRLDVVRRRSALARAGRRAGRLQDALGAHRDVALLESRLAGLSLRLTADGANAFALGRIAEAASLALVRLRKDAARRVERFR